MLFLLKKLYNKPQNKVVSGNFGAKSGKFDMYTEIQLKKKMASALECALKFAGQSRAN